MVDCPGKPRLYASVGGGIWHYHLCFDLLGVHWLQIIMFSCTEILYFCIFSVSHPLKQATFTITNTKWIRPEKKKLIFF